MLDICCVHDQKNGVDAKNIFISCNESSHHQSLLQKIVKKETQTIVQAGEQTKTNSKGQWVTQAAPEEVVPGIHILKIKKKQQTCVTTQKNNFCMIAK